MKRIICLMLLAILLAGCGAEPEETLVETIVETTVPEETAAEETEPEIYYAPDFTVVDLEGAEVHLSDFLGKPVVLNFWASWCGPCKSEMPEFDEVYQEIGEDVQFVMVNLTDGSYETWETATSFVAEAGYSFPVFYDVTGDAANTYGVSSIPTTYFIAADGELVAYASGAIDADALMQGIAMITEE